MNVVIGEDEFDRSTYVVTLNKEEGIALAKIIAKTSHKERMDDGASGVTSFAITQLYTNLPDTGWGVGVKSKQ